MIRGTYLLVLFAVALSVGKGKVVQIPVVANTLTRAQLRSAAQTLISDIVRAPTSGIVSSQRIQSNARWLTCTPPGGVRDPSQHGNSEPSNKPNVGFIKQGNVG